MNFNSSRILTSFAQTLTMNKGNLIKKIQLLADKIRNNSKFSSNYSAKNSKSFKKSLTGFFLKTFKNIFGCLFCVYCAQKAFNGTL